MFGRQINNFSFTKPRDTFDQASSSLSDISSILGTMNQSRPYNYSNSCNLSRVDENSINLDNPYISLDHSLMGNQNTNNFANSLNNSVNYTNLNNSLIASNIATASIVQSQQANLNNSQHILSQGIPSNFLATASDPFFSNQIENSHANVSMMSQSNANANNSNMVLCASQTHATLNSQFENINNNNNTMPQSFNFNQLCERSANASNITVASSASVKTRGERFLQEIGGILMRSLEQIKTEIRTEATQIFGNEEKLKTLIADKLKKLDEEFFKVLDSKLDGLNTDGDLLDDINERCDKIERNYLSNLSHIQSQVASFRIFKDFNHADIQMRFNDDSKYFRNLFLGIEKRIDNVTSSVKKELVNFKKVERMPKGKPIKKQKINESTRIIVPKKAEKESQKKKRQIKDQKKAQKVACSKAANTSLILRDLNQSTLRRQRILQ
eukprot:TRINITY_DN1326_c0_g3_i1.p1 TRINITY_DN1326_c0_g3~~TRINITY_DN1326_c0_g3_i1.p1  ORF type:complete len:441 (+),score=111.71 TRINITY_DN1326_c0_g3_i1:240-1562(+)